MPVCPCLCLYAFVCALLSSCASCASCASSSGEPSLWQRQALMSDGDTDRYRQIQTEMWTEMWSVPESQMARFTDGDTFATFD